MSLTGQIAKNIRCMHFGANWTGPDMKQQLEGITWKQATTKISNFNTIATLVFHMKYYFGIQIRVLEGGPLEGKDELSFDHPPLIQKRIGKPWWIRPGMRQNSWPGL